MPAAVAIPSIIGAGTSIVGGILGSKAAKNAGNIQVGASRDAAAGVKTAVDSGINRVDTASQDAIHAVEGGRNNANDVLTNVYGDERTQLAPYQVAGSDAITRLSQLQDFSAPTAQEAEDTPGYRFTLAQGAKALTSGAAARGLTGSSGALKSLMGFNKGLADTTYNDVYNRNLTTYNTNADRLKSLAGFGQTANGQMITAGTNYGNQVSANDMTTGLFEGNTRNSTAQFGAELGFQGAKTAGDYLTGGANAQAAGVVGSANAWGNALQGIAGSATNAGNLMTLRSMYPNLTNPTSIANGIGVPSGGGIPAGMMPPSLPGLTNPGPAPSVGSYPGTGLSSIVKNLRPTVSRAPAPVG